MAGPGPYLFWTGARFKPFSISRLSVGASATNHWKENCLDSYRERKVSMLILLIILIVLLIGATPAWPYSRGWGYYPTGVLGTILVIFLVLLLLGQVSL